MKRNSFFDGKLVILVLIMALAALAGACATEATDEEELGEQAMDFGGSPPCPAFDEDGNPNPEWPGCLSEEPLPPNCPAYPACYATCRTVHPCNTTPSQCNPLADCLDDCDAEFPMCH